MASTSWSALAALSSPETSRMMAPVTAFFYFRQAMPKSSMRTFSLASAIASLTEYPPFSADGAVIITAVLGRTRTFLCGHLAAISAGTTLLFPLWVGV